MATTTRPQGKTSARSATAEIDPCTDDWQDWLRRLQQRPSPKPLRTLLGLRSAPLLCGIELGSVGRVQLESLDALAHTRVRNTEVKDWSRLAAGWLATFQTPAAPRAVEVLTAIAWCHALPRLAAKFEPELWREAFSLLLDMAEEAVAYSPAEDPLTQQLLAAELPLTLAYTFPEVGICQSLAAAGRQAASTGLHDLLDSDGTPHARCLPYARPLMACWMRVAALSRELKAPHKRGRRESPPEFHLGAGAERLLQEFLSQLIGLSRYDGRLVFENPRQTEPPRELFRVGLGLVGDEETRLMAARALPGLSRATVKQADEPHLPAASSHSEWAGLARLRSGWERDALRFFVDHHRSNLCIELAAGQQVYISGESRAAVEVDGQMLANDGEWEEVCWFTDSEVAYVELEMALAEGWRRQRQMLLAFTDQFFWQAEVLLPPASREGEPVDLRYQSTLPLADGITATPAAETREVQLRGGKQVAHVLPMSLPEWRSDSRYGEFEITDGELRLTQRNRSAGLAAAWFIDLSPARCTRPLTWRHLTVGENLEAVAGHRAVGFRVQAGHEQWLFYRSLTAPTRRTVLGQHIGSECYVARFRFSGDVETLLEVE